MANHRPWSDTIDIAAHEQAMVNHRLVDRMREYPENLAAALPGEFGPQIELAHYYVLLGEYELAPPCYAMGMAPYERAIVEAHRRDLSEWEVNIIVAKGRLGLRQFTKDIRITHVGEAGREFKTRMQSVRSQHAKRFPPLVQTRRKQVARFERSHQMERAIDAVLTMLVSYPVNAELLEDMARLRIASGDGERAPAALREALRESRGEALVAMDLSDALLAHVDDFSENVAREMCLVLEEGLHAIDTKRSRRRAHRVASLRYGLNRGAGRPRKAIFHLARALESADGGAARDALGEGAHAWLTEIGKQGEDPETVRNAREMLRMIESYREHTPDD